jgi:hypothetical protein
LTGNEFTVGQLHGWNGILLGLSASAVFLFSGWQDQRRRFGLGSVFWFFLALLCTGGVIWLGFGARIFWGMSLGLVVFGLEVWLIRRWRVTYSV